MSVSAGESVTGCNDSLCHQGETGGQAADCSVRVFPPSVVGSTSTFATVSAVCVCVLSHARCRWVESTIQSSSLRMPVTL